VVCGVIWRTLRQKTPFPVLFAAVFLAHTARLLYNILTERQLRMHTFPCDISGLQAGFSEYRRYEELGKIKKKGERA